MSGGRIPGRGWNATLPHMGDEHQSGQPTPAALIESLLEGNHRFRSGIRMARDLPEDVAAHAGGQRPPIAFVGCIDSRAAPELVFDMGIGQAFDVRLAGAIVDDAAIGSLEYAFGAAGAVLLVVLGHTGCGAVKAACDVAAGVDVGGDRLRHLEAVVDPILEAVEAETETSTDRNSSNDAFVDRVAELNVHRTMMDLRERSNLLEELVQQDRIAIVGAMYDVRTGEVRILD